MTDSCKCWIEKFQEDFFQRGSSQTTWNGDYWKILKHLPMKQPLTQVQPNTKTGRRTAWAYHPEWFEAFDLRSVQLPQIKLDRPNEAIGRSAAHYFRDVKLPFTLMALRHRWAIRSLEYGLDYKLAARMMGHSYSIHERIYHRWIDRAVLQSAYDRSLANRPDIPLPKIL